MLRNETERANAGGASKLIGGRRPRGAGREPGGAPFCRCPCCLISAHCAERSWLHQAPHARGNHGADPRSSHAGNSCRQDAATFHQAQRGLELWRRDSTVILGGTLAAASAPLPHPSDRNGPARDEPRIGSVQAPQSHRHEHGNRDRRPADEMLQHHCPCLFRLRGHPA